MGAGGPAFPLSSSAANTHILLWGEPLNQWKILPGGTASQTSGFPLPTRWAGEHGEMPVSSHVSLRGGALRRSSSVLRGDHPLVPITGHLERPWVLAL